MEIDETFGIIAVVPLAIKYTAVAMWRPHVNGVVGLGGLLTVQACCLSRYSHYPPPQPPAQLPQKKKMPLVHFLSIQRGYIPVCNCPFVNSREVLLC